MRKLTPEAEDCLERLYMRDVEGDTALLPLPDDRVLEELKRQKLVHLREETLTLTKEGLRASETAVRRHRLAERLMQDVLNVRGEQVDAAACEFNIRCTMAWTSGSVSCSAIRPRARTGAPSHPASVAARARARRSR